jgi:hypothetical protein
MWDNTILAPLMIIVPKNHCCLLIQTIYLKAILARTSLFMLPYWPCSSHCFMGSPLLFLHMCTCLFLLPQCMAKTSPQNISRMNGDYSNTLTSLLCHGKPKKVCHIHDSSSMALNIMLWITMFILKLHLQVEGIVFSNYNASNQCKQTSPRNLYLD